MSVPNVPGFMGGGAPSLATLWSRPDGDYTAELWPYKRLATIRPQPVDWVTVREWVDVGAMSLSVSCVLVPMGQLQTALGGQDWLGRDLGSTGIWGDGHFEAGLTGRDGDVDVEFFCQVRRHHGLETPSVEMSLPFLWYWDALPRRGGWYYLTEGGHDEELIRTVSTDGEYRVEVKALQLRNYLAARNLGLVIQHDDRVHLPPADFEQARDDFKSNWAHFSWVCESGHIVTESSFSRTLGRYVVRPSSGPTGPRWTRETKADEYPEFIHGIDSSGQLMRHTCDPDQLGTYFDEDASRLHYLTPINFRANVLARYTAEPRMYEVTATRLSCLGMWGFDISTNTAGLVEVYLGDLGRDCRRRSGLTGSRTTFLRPER